MSWICMKYLLLYVKQHSIYHYSFEEWWYNLYILVGNIISLHVLFYFQTHLPGYVEKYDQLKTKGVASVACVSVNDPFVMGAWGKAQKADGKVQNIDIGHFLF